jgi:hypothetical protein
MVGLFCFDLKLKMSEMRMVLERGLLLKLVVGTR